MAVYVIEGSVMRYKRDYYVLYPLGRKNREKLRKLHRKRVYAVIVAEE